MVPSTFATFIILATIFLILFSLGFGLFNLLFSTEGNKRTLVALSFRIGLSMILFIGLLTAIHLGWIVPNPPPL